MAIMAMERRMSVFGELHQFKNQDPTGTVLIPTYNLDIISFDDGNAAP